jgi:hypothetical protein
MHEKLQHNPKIGNEDMPSHPTPLQNEVLRLYFG